MKEQFLEQIESFRFLNPYGITKQDSQGFCPPDVGGNYTVLNLVYLFDELSIVDSAILFNHTLVRLLILFRMTKQDS